MVRCESGRAVRCPLHAQEEGWPPHSQESADDPEAVWGSFQTAVLGQEEKGLGWRTLPGSEENHENSMRERESSVIFVFMLSAPWGFDLGSSQCKYRFYPASSWPREQDNDGDLSSFNWRSRARGDEGFRAKSRKKSHISHTQKIKKGITGPVETSVTPWFNWWAM